MAKKQFDNPFRRMKDRYQSMVSRLPLEISGIAIDEFSKHFREQGYDGNKWPARANDSDEDATRALLIKTGALRRGMRIAPSGDTARVVNPVEYAGIHNVGGDIKGTVTVPSYTRRDGTIVKGHNKEMNTVIPPRPYMITTVRLVNRIGNHIEKKLEEVFNTK